jgi:hypothetical protein
MPIQRPSGFLAEVRGGERYEAWCGLGHLTPITNAPDETSFC